MAALSANLAGFPVYDGSARNIPTGGDQGLVFKVGAITDEFYLGAIATYAVGTGLVVVTSLDASEFAGVIAKRASFTGSAGTCQLFIDGVFWFANTNFTDANYGKAFAATAASDNPADLVTLGAGTTGQVGRLMHVDVTATSGWLDIGIGARCALGTNS